MPAPGRSTQQQQQQRGFTLAGLLVILTILSIVLAYSVPQLWSDIMKRERDLQTIWVMKQYARAIAEFQRARGTYPVSIEQLEEQNRPRVMRQAWVDPLTGEMDWILIPVGTAPPGGSPIPGQRQRPRINPGVTNPPPEGRPTTRPAPGGQQVGAFIGVRPPLTGPSVVSLNGAETYEEWSYTTNDLLAEQNPAPGVPQGGGPATPPPRRP